jgi:tetratricopeptide (TPR) repeat protein
MDRDPDISISGCTAIIEGGQETRNNPILCSNLKCQSNLAVAFMNRGNAYEGKGQHDRALEDYDQAIRLSPNWPVAFTNRGNAYNRKGQYDRAVEDFDQAIRFNPNYAEAFSSAQSGSRLKLPPTSLRPGY